MSRGASTPPQKQTIRSFIAFIPYARIRAFSDAIVKRAKVYVLRTPIRASAIPFLQVENISRRPLLYFPGQIPRRIFHLARRREKFHPQQQAMQ
jgi:hypothetical protein